MLRVLKNHNKKIISYEWATSIVLLLDVNSTFDVIQDAEEGDLYFVGAIIALSSAIFSAANNIVVAKIVSVIITEDIGWNNMVGHPQNKETRISSLRRNLLY